VAGHTNVAATRGLVALERGPIVFAFEGLDNGGSVFDIVLPAQARVTARQRDHLLGGVTVLEVTGAAKVVRKDQGEVSTDDARLTAIPYATWANRGLTPMAVWVARDPQHARPTPRPTPASLAKVTTSFHRKDMDPARLHDQLLPQNATDGFAPNFDFWPHKGTAEWVSYEFAQPTEVRAVRVSWFDDTGKGECRLPDSWRLLHRTAGGQWQPVTGASPFAIRKNDPVRVTFEPVITSALRLEIQLIQDFSAGLYEWEVE
jgi:hypothetical protein